MSVSGDTSEQVVRMYLEGVEVLAKVSGKGAEHTIALLLNVMKDHKQTKGKARLNTMLKSGKPLSIFTISRKDLAKFSKEAKRYGVLYSALMNKLDKSEDGLVDIMVRADDASKINRIVERFKLTTSNDSQIKTEILKTRDEKSKAKTEISKDSNEKEIVATTNSKQPIDKADSNINEKSTISEEKRKSVKDEFLDIEIKKNEPNRPKGQKDQLLEMKRINDAKERMQVLKSEDIKTENFNQAKTDQSPLSEPYSKTSKTEENKPSVKKQLAEIQREMDLKTKQENIKEKTKVKKHSKNKQQITKER